MYTSKNGPLVLSRLLFQFQNIAATQVYSALSVEKQPKQLWTAVPDGRHGNIKISCDALVVYLSNDEFTIVGYLPFRFHFWVEFSMPLFQRALDDKYQGEVLLCPSIFVKANIFSLIESIKTRI